jgi:hypothetical protein
MRASCNVKTLAVAAVGVCVCLGTGRCRGALECARALAESYAKCCASAVQANVQRGVRNMRSVLHSYSEIQLDGTELARAPPHGEGAVFYRGLTEVRVRSHRCATGSTIRLMRTVDAGATLIA